MKKLLCLPLLLLFFTGLAFGQATRVSVCNSFDANGVPIYSTGGFGNATGTQVCTDYFGVGNWANSPLPAGNIPANPTPCVAPACPGAFTLVAGGSGYSTPIVDIADKTNPSGTCTATGTVTGGVVTGFNAPTGVCTGYTIPQVTIVDMGPGWTSGPATCGASPLPACGTGAMATANLVGPFTGGMPKFQAADTLPALPAGTKLAGGLTLATSDITTFPGADYYEIDLVQFTTKLHSSLPATTLRGYVQVPTGSAGCPSAAYIAANASYLGPSIVATKDKAVRVKFTNCLPTGAGGDLFIPTDTTYMGAGLGPDGTKYTQNRATLHLHGGATPWISDGTPHQWTVPVGETATLQKGLSAENVPDMYFVNGVVVPQCSATVTTNCSDPTKANLPAGAVPDPGQGSLTFYWTNQQGARLMFFHDHAYGITRLNVYAGEAAGYVLADPVEENALAAATAPGTLGTTPDLNHLIPLVIQDKTFVPGAAQLATQDPTWAGNFGFTLTPPAGPSGDLWFPHVYIPNQNPSDAIGGANGFGHWDYGAWFYPPLTSLTAAVPPTAVTVPCTSAAFPGQNLAPTTACPSCGCPITPNVSGTPEGFMDTPLVNGVAYPVLHVAPAAYRFKILSVGNDRSFNLSWFIADPTQGNTEVAMLAAAPPVTGACGGVGQPPCLCTAINPVAVPQLGLGQVGALLDNSGNPINGTGLPANCWPNYGPLAGIPAPQTMWAADGRAGGSPDPRRAGPPWIQIGSEGGLLPTPAVIPATPVNYEQNTRSITITNVAMHGLWLGPAERADVIVDFSNVQAQCTALGVSPCTLILYNDAPTPAPAFDSRQDYFTGDGDQTPIGGAPNTPAGYGPNTRTIMQVIVDQTNSNAIPFSLTSLKNAFKTTTTPPAAPNGLFAMTQPTTIVPEPAYNSAYNMTFPATYMPIAANNLSFSPIPSLLPLVFDNGQLPCTVAPCNPVLDQKTIQELFTLDYGRMNATLGTEIPTTNFTNQTTIPLGYVDYATELIQEGETQLWKITHNGVDTHFIHVHLFNVQVINRVGWDGSLRQVDPNELGWKDTVRMNPLEDILVALQPITPTFPFPLPDSIRPADVTVPLNATSGALSGLDPNSGNATITTTNLPINFGWEYVWHCHILGHEENDMMRPIIYQVPPPAPSSLVAGTATATVQLTWMDNSASETSFTLQRSSAVAPAVPFSPTDLTVTSALVNGGNSTGFSINGFGQTVTYVDSTVVPGTQYYYRVDAVDDLQRGGTTANPNPSPFKQATLASGWSNTAATGLFLQNVTFTGAPATAAYNTSFTVTATTDSGAMPTLGLTGVCSSAGFTGTSTSATATVTMTSGTGTCNLTANWAAIGNFAAATLTQTTTASLAAPTVSFTGAPASASYNTSFLVSSSTNAPVTPTITGTGACVFAPVIAASATITMTSGTGTCALTASWPATTNYSAQTLTQATTAARLGTTTTITSNLPNPAVVGQPVLVNFSVASNPAMIAALSGPTGSVTVTGNGSSCTGVLTATVGPGSATSTGNCSLSFPTSGGKTLTATYNADANFSGSASSGTAQAVWDFSMVAKTTSQTVNGNQKATYTFTLTPLGGFTGSVALTCGGNYPAAYSCTVAPTLDPLSGGKSSNVTVTVQTLKGFPGTYTVTLTGVSSPTGFTLTKTASASLTTNN